MCSTQYTVRQKSSRGGWWMRMIAPRNQTVGVVESPHRIIWITMTMRLWGWNVRQTRGEPGAEKMNLDRDWRLSPSLSVDFSNKTIPFPLLCRFSNSHLPLLWSDKFACPTPIEWKILQDEQPPRDQIRDRIRRTHQGNHFYSIEKRSIACLIIGLCMDGCVKDDDDTGWGRIWGVVAEDILHRFAVSMPNHRMNERAIN